MLESGLSKASRGLRLHILQPVGQASCALARELSKYLRIDRWIAILAVVYLVLYAPLVPRNADNPQLIAAYVNDEPFLTMALEAMLVWPYGNPANYFTGTRELPAHWGSMRYDNVIYYGGALFELAFLPYVALRAIGLPAFPTGPIVLRTITLLGGLISLIIVYNLAKSRGVPFAGLLAGIYMMTDTNFSYYATHIHPDTVQTMFGLFALVLAVAHARQGDRATLIALGLLCGIVQGTKAGGPWCVPIAMTALWLGLRLGGDWVAAEREKAVGAWRDVIRRLAILGIAALLGFFLSTPYAFLGRYYYDSMMIALGVNMSDVLQQAQKISLATWIGAIYQQLGIIGSTLVAMVLVRTVLRNWGAARDPVLILAVVLSLSQMLWFGMTGKTWLMLGYLMLAYALMSMFAFETVLLVARRLLRAER